MEITKVLKVENGFKVNDQFFVPENSDNEDYKDILVWVAAGGQIEPEFTSEQLLDNLRAKKIAQLKTNRNEALGKPYAACKAYEWDKPEIEENEIYFEFSVEATGIQLTEPNTIIFGASLGSIIKYSCIIIEGENRREGYIILNQAVAQNISAHLADRGTQYVAYANEKEAEINACTTLEQVNAININFE